MNAINTITPDWTKIDTQIKHEGKQIVLPADPGNMDFDDAIQTIARVRDQENQTFDVRETVKGAPWDALTAIYRAMQDIYGVVLAESIRTFFGEIKPDFITINTGPGQNDRIQVPSGQMSLPGVSEPVRIGMSKDGAVIIGTVRKRDRARLVEIANRAREILRTASVYRGKAIRLSVDEDGDLDLNQQPEFLDLSNVREADMIHTAETEALIRTNIFSPLKNTAACRQHRIPLKRGILLEGRYGTGKSLTSRVSAKVATDNGWTFIMLDRSQGLKSAIEFARTYQPCVIFAEDIDRAADRDNEDVNDLVSMLDGLISKEMEMMVVLTTNFIEKIDRALLRPGRFDAVISIQPPDAATAERLIRAYGRNLIAADMDLSAVGEAVSGQIPATIREVVERAKLAMLVEDRSALSADDLLISAIGMKRHMELLEPKPEGKSDAEAFFDAFKGMVAGAIGDGIESDGASQTDVIDARNTVIKHVKDVRNMQDNMISPLIGGAAAASKALEIVKGHTDKIDAIKDAVA